MVNQYHDSEHCGGIVATYGYGHTTYVMDDHEIGQQGGHGSAVCPTQETLVVVGDSGTYSHDNRQNGHKGHDINQHRANGYGIGQFNTNDHFVGEGQGGIEHANAMATANNPIPGQC